LNENLIELARLYGIETLYVDMTRQRRDADPDALLLVLRAMGAGLDGMNDVPDALRQRQDEMRKRVVEPVKVAWDGKLGSRQLELGYHEIEINGHSVFVISAPSKSYFPVSAPAWGVFAPVYALRSKRNPDAGDLTDFEDLMKWLHGLGGTVAATLPLLGAFLDEPFDASPYSPATRLFWNEFYIDLERIPEFAGHRSVESPKTTQFIDYRSVMAHKRSILEELARTFFSDATPERLQMFGKFVVENEGVDDYARFRAVTDRRRAGWRDWPARMREGTIQDGDYDEATKNYHLYSQWIVQEQLRAVSERAQARGQLLYLDLPLGLHMDGYDIWRNRNFFVEGVAGGAPPDPVFTKGQNWNFAPMNPEAMRLNRFQYVIAYLRNHFRYAKLLRIDHVMGLHRLYWIPAELTADKGVYVKYPAEELWAILSLESHLHSAGVIGENLGTVPPEVNQDMAKHDIRQMYVLQYEIMGNPDNPSLGEPPVKCVASLNTHDMPPFRAFQDGTDIDDRLDLGFLDEKTARKEREDRKTIIQVLENLGDEGAAPPSPKLRGRGGCPLVYERVLQFLSKSMANIVLVTLEDLWEETAPQNVPATSTERPNWQRRIRPSIEQIRKMGGIAEVLSDVFAQRSGSLPL
jgi:4-alpha-glucanotransferase